MNVLVTSTQTPYITGGSEVLADALVDALRVHGHRAEVLRLPFFHNPAEHAIQAMQVARMVEIGETDFGPVDRLIALKFPAYLIEHPVKVLWLIHQYRQIYDLWQEPGIGFEHLHFGQALREAVRSADTEYLPRYRRRFAISQIVADRLLAGCGIEAQRLYPPLPDPSGYTCEPAEDYFLFPSRLSSLKRQRLVLEALARTRAPVRVLFTGAPGTHDAVDGFHRQAAMLGLGDRARYLAWVSESEKRNLYARCVGVVFPPRLEDLGLIVQEAMLCAKPVVTCLDSGGVLEFVTSEENGIVSDPSPEAIAAALDSLWCDRGRAERLGRAGFDRLRALNLSWTHVVD